ncbi:MAG: hypothetical protein RLY20_1824 [Verrucomicrobiota bacterium]|jgi:type II secretory pathway pseudopilin PulG
MNLRRSNKKLSASTITEALVASVIMAICAAGLMRALAGGFRTMQRARENQRATQILMEQAEMIRLYSWDQINRPNIVPSLFTTAYDPQSPNGGGLYYTCKVSIASVPAGAFSTSYSTKMRLVTLMLQWNSNKVVRSRTNYTLVARDGFQNYVY